MFFVTNIGSQLYKYIGKKIYVKAWKLQCKMGIKIIKIWQKYGVSNF
jgi:hypothetical protein